MLLFGGINLQEELRETHEDFGCDESNNEKEVYFSHYFKESYRRLQTLFKGSRSVKDYHMEMEMSVIRANVVDDKKKKKL